jgi:hypothetical protein
VAGFVFAGLELWFRVRRRLSMPKAAEWSAFMGFSPCLLETPEEVHRSRSDLNSVSEVGVYRLAACAEVAWDYQRFVVGLAPEESQVSRCQHQHHSLSWQGRSCGCRRRQEPLPQRVHAVAVICRY